MKMKKILVSLLVLSSCSSPGKAPLPVSPPVPEALWTTPDPSRVTIAVVGINDFHGSLLPKEKKLPDGTIVKSGGAPVLASILKILKEETAGRMIVVDAGDEWQGTLESNSVQGATVVDFFNRIGIRAAAIGNHEFDFNLDRLKKRIGEASYPYVASNIYERKNGKRIHWKNTRPSVVLNAGGIRIGVIGVSTVQTPSTTRYETVKHLEFRDPVQGVIEESAKLKKQGAQAVLVTAHAGTFCKNTADLKAWRIRDPQNSPDECDPEQEIHQLSSKAGPGVLDGIIAGHTHQVIHHFLSGIPVIEGEAYNQYFNVIYYTFERSTGKLVSSETRIEGLIPICASFFEGTHHCDVRMLSGKESPRLVPARFHGRPVLPDPEVELWLKPIRESTERFRHEILAETRLPLSHPRDRESPFANLIADVLRERGHADFSLVNSGGIRTSLDAGPITTDGLFQALPFDNILRTVELTGKQVKLLYRIALSGAHGSVGISGLQATLVPFDRNVPGTDLDGDGKVSDWEKDRLLVIRFADGREFLDQGRYRVATFDFLLNGGDDFAWFMRGIPPRMISKENTGYCRDLVSDYLIKARVINTPEKPLVDPSHPRIRFQAQ